jgi:hypothetical protein
LRLEFHHRNPYGLGGDRSPENIYLMCRARNAYLAELDYGKGVMEKYRKRGDRVSEEGPGYIVSRTRAPIGFAESVKTLHA